MFAKSGGRPVYRNTKWQIIFLHYVEDERAWYFTEDWAKISKFRIFLICFCKFDRIWNFKRFLSSSSRTKFDRANSDRVCNNAWSVADSTRIWRKLTPTISLLIITNLQRKYFCTILRIYKGQISFFKKIYSELIRDKYFGKNFYQAKCCRFFLLTILLQILRHRLTLLGLFDPDVIYSFRK